MWKPPSSFPSISSPSSSCFRNKSEKLVQLKTSCSSYPSKNAATTTKLLMESATLEDAIFLSDLDWKYFIITNSHWSTLKKLGKRHQGRQRKFHKYSWQSVTLWLFVKKKGWLKVFVLWIFIVITCLESSVMSQNAFFCANKFNFCTQSRSNPNWAPKNCSRLPNLQKLLLCEVPDQQICLF